MLPSEKPYYITDEAWKEWQEQYAATTRRLQDWRTTCDNLDANLRILRSQRDSCTPNTVVLSPNTPPEVVAYIQGDE